MTSRYWVWLLCCVSLSCARGPTDELTQELPAFGELSRAVAQNDLSKVEQLLNAGAVIDENIDSDTEHISPLVVALLRGHFELARYLIDRGASTRVSYAGYNPKDFAYQVLPEDDPLILLLESRGSAREK